VSVTVVEDPSGEAQVSGVSPPRQLIVTIYGLYARQNSGWLSIASVVRLMSDLGVDDQAVRSSISRLKRRGLLVAKRVDGAAGYTLSPMAQEILAEGDARIFGRRRATVADGWLLVVFSVPETEREKRHQLRTQLTRLGFGTVAPGVWVAPGHLEAEAGEVLEQLGVTGYAELFRAQHVAFGSLAENVATWWDLEGLRRLYGVFLDRYRPVQGTNGALEEPRKAFAAYVEMLTAWRRLPYADPGLPLELLPDDWNGLAAEALFAALRERLSGPASAHVNAVLGR
jgi:phenylacetic acid degradation operon negative regulatory protein